MNILKRAPQVLKESAEERPRNRPRDEKPVSRLVLHAMNRHTVYLRCLLIKSRHAKLRGGKYVTGNESGYQSPDSIRR